MKVSWPELISSGSALLFSNLACKCCIAKANLEMQSIVGSRLGNVFAKASLLLPEAVESFVI